MTEKKLVFSILFGFPVVYTIVLIFIGAVLGNLELNVQAISSVIIPLYLGGLAFSSTGILIAGTGLFILKLFGVSKK